MVENIKKEKTKHLSFWGFNIKILSNERKGDAVYEQVFKDIFSKIPYEAISTDKGVTLKNQFEDLYMFNDSQHSLLHGKITRFTILEGDNWFNEKTKEYEKPDYNKDLHPNGSDADYILIPAAHRMYVLVQQKVSIRQIELFLNKAIAKVISTTEDFSIDLIKSKDVIERIIFAPALIDMVVNVSYTNDDAGDEAQEEIDEMLKKAQIGKISAKIKADNHGSLNTKVPLIRGLLELSKDNGYVEANVINEDGNKEKIVTTEFPNKLPIIVKPEENVNQKVFAKVMEEYRKNRNGQ